MQPQINNRYSLMLLVLRGPPQNSRLLFLVICTICWIKNAQSISLFLTSSYTRIMIKYIVFNMWHYCVPFNKVPNTSDFRRCLADIYLLSHKLNIFQIWGKNYFFAPRRRIIFMLKTLCLILSFQKPVMADFVLRLGKEEEKTGIKVRETF